MGPHGIPRGCQLSKASFAGGSLGATVGSLQRIARTLQTRPGAHTRSSCSKNVGVFAAYPASLNHRIRAGAQGASITHHRTVALCDHPTTWRTPPAACTTQHQVPEHLGEPRSFSQADEQIGPGSQRSRHGAAGRVRHRLRSLMMSFGLPAMQSPQNASRAPQSMYQASIRPDGIHSRCGFRHQVIFGSLVPAPTRSVASTTSTHFVVPARSRIAHAALVHVLRRCAHRDLSRLAILEEMSQLDHVLLLPQPPRPSAVLLPPTAGISAFCSAMLVMSCFVIVICVHETSICLTTHPTSVVRTRGPATASSTFVRLADTRHHAPTSRTAARRAPDRDMMPHWTRDHQGRKYQRQGSWLWPLVAGHGCRARLLA